MAAATVSVANRGARWDADQDAWLWLKAPLMPMAKLASTMERTPWAIRMRLLRLACEHVKAGDATLESAATHIGMTVGDLHEYEAKIEALRTTPSWAGRFRQPSYVVGPSASAT
jgi:hypothetical protein